MHNAPPGTSSTRTLTFLFTDMEGSTKRWEAYPAAMQLAFSCQEAILRHAIQANGGYAYKMIGDAFQAAFPTALSAAQAAIDAQRALYSARWPEETGEIQVRMALHTGTTEEREDDYVGPVLNRVARLLSAGHGGQVLLSEVTHGLVRDALPPGLTILDMGEHRLKDLIRPEHIFQLVVSDLPSGFPPLKTLDYRPNNLPVQPTPLVGRERELTEIENSLRREETRLITLTGPGGTGKTRLGLQAASEVLDDYRDGVWFVDLSPLTDGRLVVPTIASVLGVKEAGSQPIIDTLKEYLKGKRILLVLDNFEQVTEAAREVSALIAACPNLKVLATSRIPLHIRGEKEYPVPPLSTPDMRHPPPVERLTQYEAVRLFIERATDVRPDFKVTNENAPAVAEICVRLDGLPLAIELAAARVKMLPPQALLARLSSSISSRLKLLTGGAKDLPARQQTLRNTIEWSYDLLDEGERQLFWRMAPFSGGRSLEALEAVCNYDGQLEIDVFDGVGSLLSKSLLREVEGDSGEPRLWMLETIHEYAREKLAESGEKEALERQHALYFTTWAEQTDLTGAKQIEWMERLEDEHDNLRAALRWARGAKERGKEGEGGTEAGLRLAGAIWRFWQVRGHFSEGREQLEEVLSVPAGQGEGGAGARPRATALNGAGMLAYRQGDYAAARSLLERSLALQRELGDRLAVGAALNNLGNVAGARGEYAGARSLFEETLATWRGVENTHGTAMALNNLGLVATMERDYEGARSLVGESLAIRRELGDRVGMASSLNNLGRVEFAQGNYASARSLYRESLASRQELGDKRGIVLALAGFGGLAVAVGSGAAGATTEEEAKEGKGGVEGTKRGATMLGAVEGLLAAIGTTMEPHDRIPYEHGVTTARSLLGKEAFEKARGEGRAMTMEQAIEYALQRTLEG